LCTYHIMESSYCSGHLELVHKRISSSSIKALEWWFTSAEERLAVSRVLPPPPPPPMPRPSPKGVGLTSDPKLCPICRFVDPISSPWFDASYSSVTLRRPGSSVATLLKSRRQGSSSATHAFSSTSWRMDAVRSQGFPPASVTSGSFSRMGSRHEGEFIFLSNQMNFFIDPSLLLSLDSRAARAPVHHERRTARCPLLSFSFRGTASQLRSHDADDPDQS